MKMKKAFTLIEMLIVIIIIGMLIIMFIPRLMGARLSAEDVKRKGLVNKITAIIVSAQTQGKEFIPENGKGGCFKDYLPDIITNGLASNLSAIRDIPGNITYGTKINGCDGDFGIAKTKDGAYIVVTHLLGVNKGNYILPKKDYKTAPYFINANYIGMDGINNKTCVTVNQGDTNISCNLTNNITKGVYDNNDLKVYIEAVGF